MSSCLCGFCLCDLGKKFLLKQDDDRLHEFRCGIHVDRVGALRSSLLSQDPPPTFDRAYHAMLQEEQLQSKRGVSIDRDAVMAMAAEAPFRGKVDSRTKGAQGGPVQPRRALAAYSLSSSASIYNAGGSLSDVEWQKLKIMLSASDVRAEDRLTGKPLPSNWIIYTGASSHVTGNLSFLFDIVDIPASPIVTPDGRISNAIKHGCVRLSANLFFAPPPNNVPEACFDDENSSDASEVESQVETPASLDADVPSAALSDDGQVAEAPKGAGGVELGRDLVVGARSLGRANE
ncbi:hypothetical protein LIER_20387 [Lithospermum erythrorhizon]|uniref:Uncharacterized protein n=1 Tax=Lithospermum erythrorhizon TaxID=34254 RepID=A0AAV3QMD1_LITER